jgi:F-type H+-transporting ATPase subunit a
VSSETILSVKRFSNIIWVCVFFAAIFVAKVNAQPSSTSTTGNPPAVVSNSTNSNAAAQVQPAAGSTAEEEGLPSQFAPVLFYIGPLPVTNSILCTWIVAAIILVIVRVSTWKNIKQVPSGMQNALEAIVEGWEGLMGDILDKRVTRWVFPFATTFFIFIVISNLVDLVPGVGSIGFGTRNEHSSLPFAIENVQKPFFRPPTTDANLTIVMAAIFLVMSLFWAVRYNGFLGLIKHIFGVKIDANKWVYPLFLSLFIAIGLMEVLSILFARPVALAMRLYGNILGGATMIDMVYHNKSMLWTVVLLTLTYFYETFICILQAFVFALLVIAFVGTLCTPEDEHGH